MYFTLFSGFCEHSATPGRISPLYTLASMTDNLSLLDRYISPSARLALEERYLAPINAGAQLTQIMAGSYLHAEAGRTMPFFSDHGIVHHHDVALQVLQVLEQANGLLIPPRDPNRLAFMQGYGVLLALLHDLGMADFSAAGRAVHAQAAAQAVFRPAFTDILAQICAEDRGGLLPRLQPLAAAGLAASAQLLLRELLCLSVCHSKSNVPVEVLNDPARLHTVVQEILRQSLSEQFARHGGASAALPSLAPALPLDEFYASFETDALRWLVTPSPAARELTADVQDTLRCLRCADALRQRGSTLKTSAGYEIFINQQTAEAVYALRLGADELYLLELNEPIAASEALVAASQLDAAGNLRIALQQGAFPNAEVTRRAARYAALVTNDIQGDVVSSFVRPPDESWLLPKTAAMGILIEETADNPDFGALVLEELAARNPQAAARGRLTPSLQDADPAEAARYLAGAPLTWSAAQKREFLDRVAASGHRVGAMDVERAFEDVHQVHLESGEVLVQAGAPAGFVYIPLADGLLVSPLGGYQAFSVRAWMPIGVTGVIRGAARNATVSAGPALDLLMIPRQVYLRRWHSTYTPLELAERLARRLSSGVEAAPRD